MKEISHKKTAPATTIHGRGEIGGKAEGLIVIDQMELEGVDRLNTEIITTEFYERFRDNDDRFDSESIESLKRIHASFARIPIGVRSSEMFENDPLVATSGESSSYMLPNNHRQRERRFSQFLQAIRHIYDKFTRRMAEEGDDGNNLALVVNPVPGIASSTDAGVYYHPLSSGVADSFFKHPLTLSDGMQNPREGFARVAFGHGYAVVLDVFEVIPVATIAHPLDPAWMTKNGQQYFYAIQLDENPSISEEEMSTMSMLHLRFADPSALALFRDDKGSVNFDKLLTGNEFGYRSGLCTIMEQLQKLNSNFQIEFIWNLFDGRGVFHVVQYKRLRGADLTSIAVPKEDERTLVSTDQFQGHGVVDEIGHAIVINPFAYREELHDEVVAELRRLNAELTKQNQKYILVCPGRMGTGNRKWGFQVDFKWIANSAVIVEYGYDVKGSPAMATTADEMTGGIYGSHFLFQVLGGANEAERMRRARMFGSQGTHFLTNIYTSGMLYLFVNPVTNYLSRWFFAFPEGCERAPIYLKELEQPVSAYADLFARKCVVSRARPQRQSKWPEDRRPMIRIINPHKISQALVFAASDAIRDAARRLNNFLPNCTVSRITDPMHLNHKHFEKTFALFVDEGAMPFFDRKEFKGNNPFGIVILLSYDLRVGSAPTKQEVARICPLSSRADLVFYVNDGDCRPMRVMPAAMRYAEDIHNIEYHKQAKRFIFVVVDDELRWFSQFLPVLYRIIGQRAGVMTARTYEEATAIMEEHGSDVVCLITDILFPKNGTVTAQAGQELVASTKRKRPRIPIIIASQAEQSGELQDLGLILPKGDPGAMDTLDQYVHDFTGLGDFLFMQEGKVWARASTLAELRDVIAMAPLDMLEEYAEKDYFSTWLYMHGFKILGDNLRTRADRGDALREVLVSTFDREIAVVKEQDLVLLDANKVLVGRANTIEELAQLIERVDATILKNYSVDDVFSAWLMRKGYPELADRIRPIHGDGEELRAGLLAAFQGWIETHERD